MKKFKSVLLIMILSISLFIGLGKVNAHSVPLSKDITMPGMVINGVGTINVKNSGDNYKLYYQWVIIEPGLWNQIKELETEYDSYYETEKAKLKIKEDEIKILKADYETKEAESPGSAAALAALDAHNSAVLTYNALVDIFNAKIEEYNEKWEELTPTYIESAWKLTNDNKTSMDDNNWTGERAWVLWAKVVTADNDTKYNENIYVLNRSTGEGTPNNNNTENIPVPKTPTTVPNPPTGPNTIPFIIFSVGLIGSLGVYVLFSKKNLFVRI